MTTARIVVRTAAVALVAGATYLIGHHNGSQPKLTTYRLAEAFPENFDPTCVAPNETELVRFDLAARTLETLVDRGPITNDELSTERSTSLHGFHPGASSVIRRPSAYHLRSWIGPIEL